MSIGKVGVWRENEAAKVRKLKKVHVAVKREWIEIKVNYRTDPTEMPRKRAN